MLDSNEIRAILAHPQTHDSSGTPRSTDLLSERLREERIRQLKKKINSSTYLDMALTRLANDLAKALF